MRKKEFKRPSKMALIGGGMMAVFFIAIVIALPWQIWQSYAASTDTNPTTGLRNVRSIWATATAVSQAATATAASKKKEPTPTPKPTVKATATASSTKNGATPTPTTSSVASADFYPQFCRYFYHITTTTSTQGPVDKYTDCLNLASEFQSYLQTHNFSTGSSSNGGAWPATSLVALEVPADAGETGNSISGTDVSSVEDDLMTYLQAQATSTASQQTGYQDAMTNWNDDPLLPIALVTYSFDPGTGQPVAADATDGNPSFTAVSTFLSSDPSEVAKIQTDLMTSVQTTTSKPAGGDCSFTASSLTQSYRNCLGSDSLVDLLCDERYTSGEDANTLLNSVAPIAEDEFNGEISTYLQAHASGANATAAQNAYTFIASVSDQKMKETLIDHLLSGVVKGQ